MCGGVRGAKPLGEEMLRYALRSLARTPGFTASAILALALGIGANAAVFAVVYAILLRPLPYRAPDRLVRIFESNDALGLPRGDVSPGTFVDLRERATTLESMAIYMARDWLVSFGAGEAQETEVARGALVSPAAFPMLGVAPVLGRTFRSEADQPPPFGDSDEVVIGHALWQRRFGGRADAVGETLLLEGGRRLTVVGVMPRGFDFPARAQFWRNLVFRRTIGPDERAARFRECIARLKPEVTLERARADLSAMASRLAIEHPTSNAGYDVRVEPLDDVVTGGARPALLMLLGAVGGVLLIACANVANLFLARASARGRERAVRAALGATRLRLARERGAECLVIAAAGAGLAALMAWTGVRVLIAMAPLDTPRLHEIEFGWPVLSAIGVLAAAGALLVGAIAELSERSDTVARLLAAGGRASTPVRSGARSWLIGSQAAMTLTLLVVAVLLMRSFVALRQTDLGFDAARLLTADLMLSTARFPGVRQPWHRLAQHYDRVVDELSSLPGVETVGGITGLPLAGETPSGKYWIDDGSGARPDARQQFDAGISVVTPRYFEAMGMRVLRGRAFDRRDALSEQVLTLAADRARRADRGAVIVNEAFARRHWPGADPIGRSIVVADHWAVRASTIVGVVNDVRDASVSAAAGPAMFLPFGEVAGFHLSVAVKMRAGLAPPESAMRAALRRIDPQMLVTNVRPMGDVVSGAVAGPRFHLVLAASFAVLALTLAVLGIYGVAGYLASLRQQEIGIRIALGASVASVVTLVLRQGLAPVAIGLGCGAIGSLLASRAVSALLFGVRPFDPWSFAAAAATLAGAALVAVLVPAVRAARIDPLRALRHER
jgi:putative ABC transport system permease protein